MKYSILVLSVALVGCGCKHLEVPLQPNDKIIFTDAQRANEFRVLSGNDLMHTGSVVEITAPTSLLPKR